MKDNLIKVPLDSRTYPAVNRKAYNALSHQYRTQNEAGEFGWTDAQWREFFSRHVGSHSNALEFGPGSGRILEIISNLCGNTTAVELSPEMAAIAREKSPNANIIIADIKRVELERELFDLIFAGASIHNFPTTEIPAVLERFHRWLKTDGRFAFTTTLHEKHDEGFFIKGDFPGNHVRYRNKFSACVLEQQLWRGGFEIQDSILQKNEDPEADGEWVLGVCKKRRFLVAPGINPRTQACNSASRQVHGKS